MANNTIKRVWNANKLVSIEDLSGMTFQGENEGHTFEVSGVDDSGSAVSISGTVTAVFLRADNAAISISGSVSSGKAVATLTQNCYTVPGRFLFTIFVTANSQKTAIYSATGNVARTEGTATGSVPPLVTDSIQTGSITASGDVMVGGVLDVTNRRCYATLSSAGWYRVLYINNVNPTYAGLVIKFCINQYSSSSESHQITLSITSSGSKFINETSNGTNYVSDIRLMKVTDQSDKYYVDIKYDASTSKTVDVYFDVYIYNEYRGDITPADLSNVGPSPANETEVAKYTFLTSCVCGMFTDTRTVTTDSSGYYLFTDYGRADYAIISIAPTSPTDSYALPTGTETQWIRVWGADGSVLANTSVTLKTVFLKI